MYKIYESLLKKYADSLIKYQINSLDKDFDGAILCPACKSVHGRCIDAIYAFSICYKKYHDKKYLNAAIKLFNYSTNLLCSDGGLYNDLQNKWRGTTVFHTIDLMETLNSCKEILPSKLINKIETRIKKYAKWLFDNLTTNADAYINYIANNSLALLLVGNYFKNNDYIKQAHFLLEYVLNHISDDGFIYGEVYPHNLKTTKRCLGIDIGYNLEETLPAIAKFAHYTNDKNLLNKIYKVALAHLDFILPDGAIDNSFGVRNYKWTYYGSRTCDGMIPLCLILGSIDKRFIEAMNRNISLINKCSNDGVLYGGPDYDKANIKPCIHHSLEHINAIAYAIDNYDANFINIDRLELPTDKCFTSYLSDFASYRIANNKYILCVSNYDNNISFSGHLSGGTITLLFSKEKGVPLIVGSVNDYQLVEPLNMQVPFDIINHHPAHPRIERYINNIYYSTGYYLNSNIKFNNNSFRFITRLSSKDNQYINSDYKCFYSLKEDGLLVSISHREPFIYILPLISGELKVVKGKIINKTKTFFLTPGFISNEYQIQSDNNEIEIIIK